MSKMQLNLDNESYHTSKGFSSSQIKIAASNIELFDYGVLKKNIKNEFKEAYKMGTYFHERVLEPEIYNPIVLPAEASDRRKAPYKEWVKANPDVDLKMVMKPEEMDTLDKMFNSLESYPEALDMFNGTVNEASLFYTQNIMGIDFDLRVRPDAYNEQDCHIIDLKTSSKPIDPKSVRKSIEYLSYDLSAYMYTVAMSQHFGKPFKFSWVFVQSIAPYSTAVYTMSEEIFEAGKHKWIKAFNNIIRLNKTGNARLQREPEILGDGTELFFNA